jgi:hypothetical protein
MCCCFVVCKHTFIVFVFRNTFLFFFVCMYFLEVFCISRGFLVFMEYVVQVSFSVVHFGEMCRFGEVFYYWRESPSFLQT